MHTYKSIHGALLQRSLHWLPVKHRITYKTAVLTHKVLTTSTPPYLRDMLTVATPDRRALPALLCCFCRASVPSSLDERSQSLDQQLPPKIRLSHSVDVFKRHLKTHLFTTP